MRLACFRGPNGVRNGVIEGDRVREVRGSIFRAIQTTSTTYPLSAVRLLSPCEPSKILAVALNYRSHLGERRGSKAPEMFLKAPSSIIGPDDDIILPRRAGRVDYEGEMVVVMKRRCRNVTRRTALSYVLGYTCGNDVSARDWQRDDIQWWRAKSSDTFSSFGPWIETDVDPSNLHLVTRLNGKVVQDTNTGLLIHDVPTIISFTSRVMTLEPGDIIYTGTPGQTAQLSPGDVVEVEVGGVGVLRNPAQREGAA